MKQTIQLLGYPHDLGNLQIYIYILCTYHIPMIPSFCHRNPPKNHHFTIQPYVKSWKPPHFTPQKKIGEKVKYDRIYPYVYVYISIFHPKKYMCHMWPSWINIIQVTALAQGTAFFQVCCSPSPGGQICGFSRSIVAPSGQAPVPAPSSRSLARAVETISIFMAFP